MSDYSQNQHNGSGVAELPRVHPDAVRSWRNDMSAKVNEFLSDIRSLEAALAERSTPSESTAAAERFRASSTSEPAARPAPLSPASPAPPPAQPSGSAQEQEFDARLANLKKMLAEKLTNAEGGE